MTERESAPPSRLSPDTRRIIRQRGLSRVMREYLERESETAIEKVGIDAALEDALIEVPAEDRPESDTRVLERCNVGD